MLIFLDIDGVMVPSKSWERPELLTDGFPAFSAKATTILKSLISEDTTVLLTTSHKSRFTFQQWKRIFASRGIQLQTLKVLENNTRNLSRKDEILQWFTLNVISEDFLIIDDDKSLNALPIYLKSNLILTKPMIGLVDNDLEVYRSVQSRGLLAV
ncbi:MAG: HAD domain-containing protein [Saprospiraceae bacterium]